MVLTAFITPEMYYFVLQCRTMGSQRWSWEPISLDQIRSEPLQPFLPALGMAPSLFEQMLA